MAPVRQRARPPLAWRVAVCVAAFFGAVVGHSAAAHSHARGLRQPMDAASVPVDSRSPISVGDAGPQILSGGSAAQPSRSPTLRPDTASVPAASGLDSSGRQTPVQAIGSTLFGGACSWDNGDADCESGYVCVALPTNISEGVCASGPPGGLPLPLGLQAPVFYFPLVNGTGLSSWPWASRSAQLVGRTAGSLQARGSENDVQYAPAQAGDRVQGALQCPGGGEVYQIDNFLYGRTGAFTINLWAQAAQPTTRANTPASNTPAAPGTAFEYLLSQSNPGPAASLFPPFAPNQLALYVPGPGRPLAGVVRAVVKDSNDGPNPVYLDSDGVVSDNRRRAPLASLASNVSDGAWHMITLSSRTDGGRGFLLYVDGALAGQVPSSSSGGSAEADGGDALLMTAPLVLCGRSDADPTRAFTGRLAHLMVFDIALGALDVQALYGAMGARSRPITPSAGVRLPLPPSSSMGGDTTDISAAGVSAGLPGPLLFDTTAMYWPRVPASFRAPSPPPSARGVPVASAPEPATGGTGGAQPPVVQAYDGQEGDECTLDLAQAYGLQFCSAGLVCVPVRTWEADGRRVSPHFPDGVCTAPQPGTLLPERFPPSFPVPLAYFPLTGPAPGDNSPAVGLASWPDGAYSGNLTSGLPPGDSLISAGDTAGGGAAGGPGAAGSSPGGATSASGPQFTFDTRFGSALMCNQTVQRGAGVLLDPVPYATTGGFAVNLWMRTTPDGLNGTAFSYLFSHAATNVTDLMKSPNQVHVFVPQRSSAFPGVSARVILRDSRSPDRGRASEVWLDSNGLVGNDDATDPADDGVRIDDGEWHMITVTTLPGLMDAPWAPEQPAPDGSAPAGLAGAADAASPDGPVSESGGDAAAGGSAASNTSGAAGGGGSSGEAGGGPPRPPGYALYVDGVLRGVVRSGSSRDTLDSNDTDVQVTGGWPVYMDGPIHLCARADGDPDRGFTGALAQLSLYDVALLPSQVAELYSAYSRQSVVYPLADVTSGGLTANRSTVSGEPCVFPFSYGGRLYFDCVYLAGLLSCPTQANGTWAACAAPEGWDVPEEDLDLSALEIADGSSVGAALGGIPRVTTSGQVCLLPFSLDGNTYADCVTREGTQQCMLPGRRMQECEPLVQRALSAPGTCRDPRAGALSGDDDRFKQCLSIKGVTMCETPRGTWVYCPPAVGPRVALSGLPCRIPFTFAGHVRSDCVIDPGGGAAAGLGTPGVSGGAGQDSSSGSGSGVGGEVEVCPATDINTITGRSTPQSPRTGGTSSGGTEEGLGAQGDATATPGTSTSGGAAGGGGAGAASGDQAGGATPGVGFSWQQCQPAFAPSSLLQSRAPTRFAIDGTRCKPPGPASLSECLDYDGSGVPQCQTESGAVFTCAATSRNGTVTNAACVFPFAYRGFNRTDCVWLDGVEACRTGANKWEECRPWVRTLLPTPPPNATARFGASGVPCAVPFSYQGRPVWDCLGGDADSPGYCRATDGTWQLCDGLRTNLTRSTVGDGGDCVLPFTYRGVTYYDCMQQDPYRGSAGVCLSRAGRFVACAPRNRTGVITGAPCVFPASWNGQNVTDCVIGPVPSGQPACLTRSTRDNLTRWEACGPPYTPPGTPLIDADPGTGGKEGRNVSVPVVVLPGAGAGAVLGPGEGATLGGSDGAGAPGQQLSAQQAPADADASPTGAPSPSDGDDGDNNKTRDLALGLVFGLGGGLLLLAAGLGALHRAWVRRRRAAVMREMGLSGPGAAESLATGGFTSGRSSTGGPTAGPTGLTGLTGASADNRAAWTGSSPAGARNPGLELGASAHTFARKKLPPSTYSGGASTGTASEYGGGESRGQAGFTGGKGGFSRGAGTTGADSSLASVGSVDTDVGGGPGGPVSPFQALRAELRREVAKSPSSVGSMRRTGGLAGAGDTTMGSAGERSSTGVGDVRSPSFRRAVPSVQPATPTLSHPGGPVPPGRDPQ